MTIFRGKSQLACPALRRGLSFQFPFASKMLTLPENDHLGHCLPETMTNVSEISRRLNKTSQKLEETIQDVAELERMVSKEIRDPLQSLAETVAMLLRLVNKLFDRRRK